ncbi:AsnC family transcriptional regulator [Magnetospira thiophila]
MNESDKRLLDAFQHGFPLSPRPYAVVAEQLGMSEDDVLAAYRRLCDDGYISRIGAVIKPHTVGASTLAAMYVPEDRLAEVAAYVSALDEVNHNYQREHTFNLWFVITAPNERRMAQVLTSIAQETGLSVMSLPMIEDYHLDLGFPIIWN